MTPGSRVASVHWSLLQVDRDPLPEVVLIGDRLGDHRAQAATDGYAPGSDRRDQGTRHLRRHRLHLRPVDLIGKGAHRRG